MAKPGEKAENTRAKERVRNAMPVAFPVNLLLKLKVNI